MKRYVKYLILMLLMIIPVFLNADTYSDATSKASGIYNRAEYTNTWNRYLQKSSSGSHGELIDINDYILTMKKGKTYLFDGTQYFTRNISGDKVYVIRVQTNKEIANKNLTYSSMTVDEGYKTRVVVNVKPETKVVGGTGSYSDPWYFSTMFKVNAEVNSKKYGEIIDTEPKYVRAMCNDVDCISFIRFKINSKYRYLDNDCNAKVYVVNKNGTEYNSISVFEGYEERKVTDTSEFNNLKTILNNNGVGELSDNNVGLVEMSMVRRNTTCHLFLGTGYYKISVPEATPDTIYLRYGENYYKVVEVEGKEETQVITKLDSVIDRVGQKFLGYKHGTTQIIDSNKNILPNTKTAITEDTTLDIMREANKYTISYDYKGGVCGGDCPTEGTYGSTLTITNPQRVGYTFDGWNISGMDTTQHYIGNTTTTTQTVSGTKATSFKNLRSTEGTVNFEATWTAKQVTVTLDPNGGSVSPTSMTVTYASAYGTLPTPTRQGHEFTGWYLDSTKIESTTTVSRETSHTLVAHWNKNEYTITLNRQSGSGGPEAIYERYNNAWYSTLGGTTAITTITTPTRAGYTFGGYYTATSGGGTKIIDKTGKIVASATTFTADTTVYAYWYTTIFVAGGTLRSKMLGLTSVGNIKSFVRANTLTNGSKIEVQASGSGGKIYMWYDSNTIYYYSEDPTVYLNSDSNGIFNGFLNLTNISGLTTKSSGSSLSTSKVTNMESMFQDCVSLQNIEPLRNWDVSKVTTLHDFFNIKDSMINATGKLGSLTTLEPLKNWTVSNVTSLEEFVQDHPKITSYEGLGNWDVSKVTTLYSAFGISANGFNVTGAESLLTDISALSGWNVSNVTSIQNMLRHSHKVTNLNALSNWKTKTGKITQMKQAFADMYALSDISGLTNWNTASLTSLESTFTSDYSLTNIAPLQNWNVSKVTTFRYLFNINDKVVDKYHVKGKISSLAPLSSWNTASAIDMKGMFQDQLTFTNVADVKNFKIGKINNVNNISSIFGTSGVSKNLGYTCTLSGKSSITSGWNFNTTDIKNKVKSALDKCGGS